MPKMKVDEVPVEGFSIKATTARLGMDRHQLWRFVHNLSPEERPVVRHHVYPADWVLRWERRLRYRDALVYFGVLYFNEPLVEAPNPPSDAVVECSSCGRVGYCSPFTPSRYYCSYCGHEGEVGREMDY